MRYIVAAALVLAFFQAMKPVKHEKNGSPRPGWDSVIHWRIYEEVNFQRVLNVSKDSLHFWKSESLNDDSMHAFLKGTKRIEGVKPLFQGCYLASCEDSKGNVFKVMVSQNGDFFFCQEDTTYVELNADVRSDWLSYLRLSYLRFVQ